MIKQAHGVGGVGSTKPKKPTATTKSQTKRKSKSVDAIPSEDSSSLKLNSGETQEEERIKDWSPQSVLTDWGRTDDVVTIGNGERYYFFKIPHKVGSRRQKKEKRVYHVYICLSSYRIASSAGSSQLFNVFSMQH